MEVILIKGFVSVKKYICNFCVVVIANHSTSFLWLFCYAVSYRSRLVVVLKNCNYKSEMSWTNKQLIFFYLFEFAAWQRREIVLSDFVSNVGRFPPRFLLDPRLFRQSQGPSRLFEIGHVGGNDVWNVLRRFDRRRRQPNRNIDDALVSLEIVVKTFSRNK